MRGESPQTNANCTSHAAGHKIKKKPKASKENEPARTTAFSLLFNFLQGLWDPKSIKGGSKEEQLKTPRLYLPGIQHLDEKRKLTIVRAFYLLCTKL